MTNQQEKHLNNLQIWQAVAAVLGAMAAVLATLYAIVTRPLLKAMEGVQLQQTSIQGQITGIQTSIQAQITGMQTSIQGQLNDIVARLGRIETKLDNHEQRITRLEERTSPLRH